MQISESYATVINVTFIFLLIGFGIYGYFRGLFKQGLDLVSMLIVAWLATLYFIIFNNILFLHSLRQCQRTIHRITDTFQ